jgi:predicted outer membrane repeat protein
LRKVTVAIRSLWAPARGPGGLSGGGRAASVVVYVLVGVVSIGASVCSAASFEGLGYLPGGTCSEATAVSADGSVVVGTGCTASGVQAFRWTAAERIVGIPIPAGLIESWATDVSADGKYVLGHGRKSDSPPYEYEGFRWHVSGALDRIAAPGLNIIAKGISGGGSIAVGTSWGVGIDDEVFRWTAQGGIARLVGLPAGGANRTNADGISADGLVVVGDGIYDGDPYRNCFRWTEGEVIELDAHTANATSSDGAVVVGALDNHETALFEAYRWTRETGIVLLGTCLPNYHSRALAVSSDGSVVVGYVQNNSGFDEQKAFIWDQEHGMRLLQDVLEDDFGLDLSGWKLTETWASWKATGISQDGLTIVGVALNPEGQREAWRAVLRTAVYVDADATGANDGSSWMNAYRHLQDALAYADSAAKPIEIRVAEGVYKPDRGGGRTPGDKEATFRLINGVTIRGGYAGVGETNPDAQDVNEYETVLSGDLGGNDVGVSDAAKLLDEPSREENCYHVVTGHETDETAVLDGCTITSGNANRGYWVAYYGGGITADSAGLTLLNCKIEGNVAAQGGGLHIGSGGAKVSGCTFNGNAAVHAGGMLNGGRATTVADCAFLDNYADTGGGATICTDAAFTRCSFVRNRAGASTGGAVNNDCSAPKFDHCTFIENTAPYAGGAIRNFEGDLTITYCKFIGNSSDNGGGIYQGDTDTVLTGCEFTDNEAITGGGISNDGYSDPTLTECTFTNNSAEYGGGFYNTTGSAPRLTKCTFSGNSATQGGGAIASLNNYLFGPVLADCLLSGNTARLGGAIYNDDTNMMLTDCTFSRNSAGYEGGGFYNLTGQPVLNGCVFAENRSEQDGGGMQNDDGSPRLIGCIFANNFAADEGGGLCNEDDKPPGPLAGAPPLNPVLTNCVFVGNAANGHGGAICNDQSNPRLTNCTFAGNTAESGGGMYSENGSAATLSNCILWSDAPDELHNDNATTTVVFSDVQGGWEGKGNIDADPRFADPNSGDYHLKSEAGRWDANEGRWTIDAVTSPCIDAGDPMSPIGYEPFPNGGVINMGAYGGTAEASKSYFGRPACETIVPGDINGDCVIDFRDFCIMALHWSEDNN